MTCIDKLKELRPHVNDRSVHDYIRSYCPSEFGIMTNRKDCNAQFDECVACWGREIPGTNPEPDIPWEFEYVSKCTIDDGEGNLDEHEERIWVHILMSWDKQRYTGKPCYKIRLEQESGYMWEGWCTEEDIMEMLEYRVVGKEE